MTVAHTLAELGWSAFFADQCRPDEADLVPQRVATVHRARMGALAEAGPVKLMLPVHTNTGDYAVGDWVLVEAGTQMLRRRLDRRTVLERRREGSVAPQLAAANVDTLFIVTSCNADFNPTRLERYLALANQGGAEPVIVLTKADAAVDAERYRREAGALQRDLAVTLVNPARVRGSDAARPLVRPRPHRGGGRLLGGRQVDPGEHPGGPGATRRLRRREASGSTMRRAGTPRRADRSTPSRAAAG